jgi:hypothetical protein
MPLRTDKRLLGAFLFAPCAKQIIPSRDVTVALIFLDKFISCIVFTEKTSAYESLKLSWLLGKGGSIKLSCRFRETNADE